MTQLLHAYPFGDFPVVPSLVQFATRLAEPGKQALAASSAAGLCVADIADVSLFATAKNGLKVRRKSREF